jgi:nucleotide-binding universal stress UspA family protein
MQEFAELNVLFVTKFTDACFRAIRAIAQLADVFRVSITIAHVDDEGLHGSRDLQSFFAEADHYESCRRVQLHGPVSAAIRELVRKSDFDLILAPRSDRLGIPRPLHRSLRATLLRAAGTPIWSGARWLDSGEFLRPYRTVAVGLDGQGGPLNHVRLAASFAARIGAELRLLTVVPHVHEGTLASSLVGAEPLSEDAAKHRVSELFSSWSQIPKVDVAIGAPEREIPRMARNCSADLLFLNESQSCGGLFFGQIRRTVDESPCGVVVVPDTLSPGFQWTFATPAAKASRSSFIDSKEHLRSTEPLLLSQ